MQVVVRTQPWGSEKELYIRVSINGLSIVVFLVKTGATFSCIRIQGMNFPLLNNKLTPWGFSRKTQVLHFTEPQKLNIDGQTLIAPMLYSKDTPVNLLGRDSLCKLKTKILYSWWDPSRISWILADSTNYWGNNKGSLCSAFWTLAKTHGGPSEQRLWGMETMATTDETRPHYG